MSARPGLRVVCRALAGQPDLDGLRGAPATLSVREAGQRLGINPARLLVPLCAPSVASPVRLADVRRLGGARPADLVEWQRAYRAAAHRSPHRRPYTLVRP